MAKQAATDTVVDNGVEDQVGMKDERSEHNRCEMCQFLFEGYKKAHSRQAKAEYGEGFLEHYIRHHPDVFGVI